MLAQAFGQTYSVRFIQVDGPPALWLLVSESYPKHCLVFAESDRASITITKRGVGQPHRLPPLFGGYGYRETAAFLCIKKHFVRLAVPENSYN